MYDLQKAFVKILTEGLCKSAYGKRKSALCKILTERVRATVFILLFLSAYMVKLLII